MWSRGRDIARLARARFCGNEIVLEGVQFEEPHATDETGADATGTGGAHEDWKSCARILEAIWLTDFDDGRTRGIRRWRAQ